MASVFWLSLDIKITAHRQAYGTPAHRQAYGLHTRQFTITFLSLHVAS